MVILEVDWKSFETNHSSWDDVKFWLKATYYTSNSCLTDADTMQLQYGNSNTLHVMKIVKKALHKTIKYQ